MAATTRVRFDYYPDDSNLMYKGEAEISEARDDNGELLSSLVLLEVWRFGLTEGVEVYPYEPGFDANLRAELEQAALEALSTPPMFAVVLPSDLEPFTVKSAKMLYEIETTIPLPIISTYSDARAHGLVVVTKIRPTGHKNGYLITAIGGINEVIRELRTSRNL